MVLFSVATVAVLLLKGVSSAYGQPSQNRSAEVQWVDCSLNVPQPLQIALNITTWNTSSNPDLPPLPASLKCGRLDVPMDYTQAFDDNNKINIGFAVNRPAHPKGVIFYNPGGPGGEAISIAWQLALNNTDIFRGLEDFEFMMMDVRGTWSSNPVNCSAEAFSKIPIPYPRTQDDFNVLQAAVKSFGQSCIDLSTPPGIIGHVGTQDAVEDWESIRLALSYGKVDLLGISYGTYYFSEYAYRYPESVGRVVLDAVVGHGLSDLSEIDNDIKAVNRLLLRADAFCLSNSTCPFHDQGKGAVPKAFEKVLQQAIAASPCPNSTVCDPLTARYLRNAVTIAFFGTPQYSSLFAGLELALQGDTSFFPPGPSTTGFVAIPLVCLDEVIDNDTFAGIDQFRSGTAQDDTFHVMASIMWQQKLFCVGWPFPGRPKTTLPTDLPLLWVTADFDLNTPTEGATFAWKQAPNSTLIVRHGDDHGTTEVLGSPARDIFIEYLRTGVIANSSNETLATVYRPGSTRGPIPDPYTVPVGAPAGDFQSF